MCGWLFNVVPGQAAKQKTSESESSTQGEQEAA